MADIIICDRIHLYMCLVATLGNNDRQGFLHIYKYLVVHSIMPIVEILNCIVYAPVVKFFEGDVLV